MLEQVRGEESSAWLSGAVALEPSMCAEPIATFRDGRSVRAWRDVVGWRGVQRMLLLRAQVFDCDGDADGEVLTLCARPSTCAAAVRGVSLGERRFAIVWIDNSGGDSAQGARTRVFDLRGFPLGNEIRLGSVPTVDAASLAIAATPGGGYVAAWVGATASGAEHVHAAAFDAHGALRGARECASHHAVKAPCAVHLAVFPGGGFVVSWSERASIQAREMAWIRTRMFDCNGVRVGSEFLCRFRT